MDESFVEELRKALNHLYDPDYLLESPLCDFLNIKSDYDRGVKLQKIVESAILELQPKENEPPGNHSWQVFEILTYRYLQQFSQKEVADQIGVSISQLGRVQRRALYILALHIWDGFRANAEKDTAVGEECQAGLLERKNELSWMIAPSGERISDVIKVVLEVQNLVEPLFAQYDCCLEVIPSEPLPRAAVHPVALRQILLNLLTHALHASARERIRMMVALVSDSIIQITVVGNLNAEQKNKRTSEMLFDLSSVQQLCTISEILLDIDWNMDQYRAVLHISSINSIPVMVIDDSLDHFQLLQRYAVTTKFKLYHVIDYIEAEAFLREKCPEVIMIDIMLPHVDGWSIMQQLRSQPEMENIPIIVCSILPLDELALSLGANAFLRKPINQKTLISVLEKAIELGSKAI